jgi:hypothetical protein
MSLARYLSKLGALLNSDGKVPSGALASGAARANFGAGAVLQVIHNIYALWTTTTSTSAISTGLSATITPAASSNKVLVRISANGIYNSSTSNSVFLMLYKNGSFLAYLDWNFSYNILSYGAAGSYEYLDSPSTTSATTYQLYWASANGSTIGINNYSGSGSNDGRTKSSIVLTEIAA